MAIFMTKEYGEKNKKVIFLLAGWHMRHWSLWPAAKLLEINGYYCICCAYDNGVFSPNVSKTVKSLLSIKNDILEWISNLKKNGYNEFGGSLGSLIAVLVANESEDISKLILNTAGSDPAENMWVSDITKGKFKAEIIKQGYTLEKLQKAWKPISPIHNLDKLKNKKILVYLSKRDRVIPFPVGMKLIQAFEKKQYKYQLIVNPRLGHMYTSLYNSVRANVYLDFLKS